MSGVCLPRLSVVIPTYNRRAILARVLDALARQTVPVASFEVIVVDDGSSDGTRDLFAAPRPGLDGNLDATYLRQENAGPAAARNRGLERSRSPLVVFLGDDTVPRPDFLGQHLFRHRRAAAEGGDGDRLAVLGYTGWPAGIPVTPFRHFVNEYGLQFGYAIIPDPESVPFNFFYTSNISLPRRLIESAGGFDTRFPYAAWEDTELAYRMNRLGMRLVYHPAARVEHHHWIDIPGFTRRQEKAGYCGALFLEKNPELRQFLFLGKPGLAADGWARRSLFAGLEIFLRGLDGLGWVPRPHWFERLMHYHYENGMRRGLADVARNKPARGAVYGQ